MSQAKRKLAAIMAADVAGYSRLMGADEEGTVAALDACRTIFRSTIEHHDGRVVDTAGDSVLATFDSVVEAVRCSVELQGTLSARDADLADDRRMQFRIGVNLGDVITKGDGTIYGDGVNVAARLESLAEPGGIAVSGTVFDHAENKLPVAFEFIGEHEVKNIAKPVQVYRVRDNVDEDSQTFAATNSTTTDDPVLAMPTGPTIAILPFTNMSSDPEQEYFSDGITEEIITELARFQTLHVLARNSTFQYKGKAVDVRSVGKELGARYVVEGSIRRAADTIRVTAQLLDVNDGTHLWADTFERKLTANNIFEVQDEVTQKIVAVIGDSYGIISAVALQDRSSRRAESIDAYQCVLAAREFYASPTPKKHLDVRAGLERAVELAPSYADAWAWLAAIYREEHSSGFNPRPGSLDRAERQRREPSNWISEIRKRIWSLPTSTSSGINSSRLGYKRNVPSR